jgi:hypothetical protein
MQNEECKMKSAEWDWHLPSAFCIFTLPFAFSPTGSIGRKAAPGCVKL